MQRWTGRIEPREQIRYSWLDLTEFHVLRFAACGQFRFRADHLQNRLHQICPCADNGRAFKELRKLLLRPVPMLRIRQKKREQDVLLLPMELRLQQRREFVNGIGKHVQRAPDGLRTGQIYTGELQLVDRIIATAGREKLQVSAGVAGLKDMLGNGHS